MKNKQVLLLSLLGILLVQQLLIAQANVITGEITKYPTVLKPGESFNLESKTNARYVSYELYQGNKRIWRGYDYPKNEFSTKTGRISSTIDPGQAKFILIDKKSGKVLDEKNTVIESKNGNTNVQNPSSPIVPEIFGNFIEFPSYIIPGIDFTILANSNAKKVTFEIYKDNKRVWRKTVSPNSSNKVQVKDNVISTTKLGEATLLVKDYYTNKILDQKTISIVNKIPGQTGNNQDNDQGNNNPNSEKIIEVKPILFSLPDFPENGRVMEGDWIKASVNQGVPYSQFSIEVLYDGNIVYQHGFAESDGNGIAFVQFQMPYKILRPEYEVDGLVIRLSHGGVEINKPFTLVKGLDIIVPSELKEGETFTYEVKNSVGNTAIKAGINYDAGPDHEFGMKETDGSGYVKITETMPRLITNRAERDGAEFWVETKDVRWYFQITIVKGEKQTEKKAEVKGIKTTNGKVVYPLPKGIDSNNLQDISIKFLSPDLNIDDTLRSGGIRLLNQINKPSFQYISGESNVINSNLHKFHVSYSGISSSTGYLQLRRVIANVYYPPGTLNTICTETEVYSSGKLVKKVENNCENFFSVPITAKSVSVISLNIPLDEIGPIIKRGDSEIIVTIRYMYVGPFGEDSVVEGHDDTTAGTPKWIGILRDLIVCDVDDTNPIFIGDPCSKLPTDWAGVIEKTNNRLSGKVRIAVQIN